MFRKADAAALPALPLASPRLQSAQIPNTLRHSPAPCWSAPRHRRTPRIRCEAILHAGTGRPTVRARRGGVSAEPPRARLRPERARCLRFARVGWGKAGETRNFASAPRWPSNPPPVTKGQYGGDPLSLTAAAAGSKI